MDFYYDKFLWVPVSILLFTLCGTIHLENRKEEENEKRNFRNCRRFRRRTAWDRINLG